MFEKSKSKFQMRGPFTRKNSALVLVDYQVGTLQLIRSSGADVSLRNAVMLAKAAVKRASSARLECIEPPSRRLIKLRRSRSIRSRLPSLRLAATKQWEQKWLRC